MNPEQNMEKSASRIYINNHQQLVDFCQSIQSAPWIALDTEFQREKTYYAKLALVQIATTETSACIDPLVLENLEPLRELLYNPKILKVLHAASQDLEIFVQLWGGVPMPIFDTQLAAPLLGYAEQIGYAKLVAELCAVTLSKAHTRTDWTKRPLSPAQLSYAEDDVIYLVQVFQKMHTTLQQQGRLDWLQDEFAKLTDENRYKIKPDEAWRRIKPLHKLKGKNLATAQAIAAWREQTAQQNNLPRNWLLKDESIMDIAKLQPTDNKELASLRGLTTKFLSQHGDDLLNILTQQHAAPQSLPDKQQRLPMSANQQALLAALESLLTIIAEQHELNPSSILGRTELIKLTQGEKPTNLLNDWRYDMAGKAIETFLAGHSKLCVSNGELVVATT